MWDGCPALEYRLLAVAVIAFGFWLDSVSGRTHECGCLVKLLWFFSMLGVILYTGWFGIVWTRWAWGILAILDSGRSFAPPYFLLLTSPVGLVLRGFPYAGRIFLRTRTS